MKKPEKDGTANDPLLAEFEAAVRYGQGDAVSALVELLSERPGFDRSVIQLQGTTVAGYRLEQLVGVGGVGATYRAIDAAGSEVAVKIVGGLTGSRRHRFDSECTILRGLAHPNIVRYRDHGVLEPDKGFLVMDYVRGANLETVLLGTGRHSAAATVTAAFRGPLATDQEDDLARDEYRRRVIRIVAKIARAVHAAHDAGIIHRDLKPGNVMLAEDLEPILIDFGLSRNLRRDGSLTDSHLLIGTLAYMAPEQLEGNPDAVDGQADVFALGLILYRLLVGEDLRPDVEAVVRYRRRPLVLERTGARVLPVELRAILYRCLEPRKQSRYPDALALEADLMAWLEGRPIAARRPFLTTRWRRTPLGRGAAVAGLGAAIVSLVIAIWPPPEARTTIDCLIDCGLAIDEVSLQRPTPFIGLDLLHGAHTFSVERNGAQWPVKGRFEHGKTRGRVVILNVSEDPKWGVEIARRDYAGDDAAVLQIVCGEPEATIHMEGAPHPLPLGVWVTVEPGFHRITATNPNGHSEVQAVDLVPQQLNRVYLLSEPLSEFAGDYRRTLAAVVSPTPADVSFHLGPRVNRFLNGFEDEDMQAVGRMCYRTCITAEETRRAETAILRVTFPLPMQSLAFHNMSNVRPPGELELSYRTEDSGWIGIGWEERPIQVEVSAPGTSWFELRATMECELVPLGYAAVEFLWGYVDVPSDLYRPPCFSIVADPRPGVARWRR